MNKKKQDETEKICLDFVKENICTFKNGEVLPKHILEEREYLKEIFNSAMSNEAGTTFPDFIFDGGFIEHFKITSLLHESGKGSKFIQEYRIHDKLFEKKIEKVCSEHITKTTSLSPHNHEDLLKSLEKNINHHIDSYHKYENKNKTELKKRIFLIHYEDDMFRVKYIGETQPYSVLLDKKFLEVLAQFSSEIGYFIIVSEDESRVAYPYSGKIEILSEELIDKILMEDNFNSHEIVGIGKSITSSRRTIQGIGINTDV